LSIKRFLTAAGLTRRGFYAPSTLGMEKAIFLKCFFVDLPYLATYIFLIFSTNEPELGARINPGVVFKCLTISI
jgi:hypothetical protein